MLARCLSRPTLIACLALVAVAACSADAEPEASSTSTIAAASSSTTTVTTTVPMGADDPTLPVGLASERLVIDESLVLAPGSSISYEGTVGPGEKALYRLLDAASDTALVVTITPSDGSASFEIYGPGDQILDEGSGEMSITLSEDGRYLVVVGSAEGEIEFSITIGVE